MKQEIEPELKNLINWLEVNELTVASFVPKKSINHPVLDRTEVIDNIVSAIKSGNLTAIELGCDLIIQNKHIPFGKVLKCNILTALKPESRYISPECRQSLAELAVKYLNSDYPAKETKPLCKLLKKFERKYSEYVLDHVHRDTEEAQRWINYLSN